VTLEPASPAIGRSLAELHLEAQVRAVRRRGTKAKLSAPEAGALQAGDVVVLLGAPESLAAAEERLGAR
jgi:CPA2 family monovalent cation:H+ antiporter-2